MSERERERGKRGKRKSESARERPVAEEEREETADNNIQQKTKEKNQPEVCNPPQEIRLFRVTSCSASPAR